MGTGWTTAQIQEQHRLASRRRFLRGAGVCMALPALQSLLPSTSRAATSAATELAITKSGAPLRMAFVYVPNGAQQGFWWPQGDSREFEFNRTMKPLEPLRDQVQVFGGLDHQHAEAGPDGAGDHARANATFLTGVRARKTSGSNIELGVSIDQVAAKHVGHLTRLPSLELTCDSIRKSGQCDSGYSCAYQYNISWQSASSPMTPEPNPRLVFERLFGADSRRSSQEKRRSIIDFVRDDASALRRDLGQQDQRKLDEYLGGVRELEQRIARSAQFGELPQAPIDSPAGIPADYGDHLKIMFDLLAFAFQTDSTRIATLLMAHDGSNRAFPELGVAEGHHYMTHHQHDETYREKICRIDVFYMEHFASFLKRLDQIQDIDGSSVLHNSMILYGSGNADANFHTHRNLPAVLAGKGGGGLQPGHYRKLNSVPMCNLFLGMLDRLGVPENEGFGDSTDRLTDI